MDANVAQAYHMLDAKDKVVVDSVIMLLQEKVLDRISLGQTVRAQFKDVSKLSVRVTGLEERAV